MWLNLQLPTNEYDELITARIKKAVWPVGLAANYLHSKYEGKVLDQIQLDIAKAFLKHYLDDQNVKELEHFEANRASFNYLAQNCSDPFGFWTLCKPFYLKFSYFARSILIIPASTARLEGLFSEWMYEHN